MKKILLLGGSAQQVIAIQTAKRLGLYTILCDYLSDNPGQYEADRFYLISTTDKEAILKIAKEECIDGIIAYASDPAAPTAAYVSEALGLPGNPYEAVQILCNKDKFRNFLKDNGFNAPLAKGYSAKEEIVKDKDTYHLPVIIKPVDSSGSKGATVLYSWEGLPQAIDFAFSYSRTHRLIVEEYIEKKHKYLIGGDIFVFEGKVIQWGLMNCHRDSMVNPLVPVGKSYPLYLQESDIENVKSTLQSMVDKLGIKSGPMNVELVIDKTGKVWPIDVGPRSGGNMIPDLLGIIFDADIVEMSIRVAMGMPIKVGEMNGKPFYATHNLHVAETGMFEGIIYSKQIKDHIIKECVYKKIGDHVEFFDNASKAIGIIFLKFHDQSEMEQMMNDINQHVKVEVSHF